MMKTGSLPLALNVEDGDLLDIAVMLHDRRDHALAVLDELRANRTRLKRVTAVTGFVSSTLFGLMIGIATGSMVLGHLTPFEHLWRSSAPRFKNSGSPRFWSSQPPVRGARFLTTNLTTIIPPSAAPLGSSSMISHGRVVTYLRVSTDRQGKSGLGLDAQREAIRIHLGGIKPIAEMVEVESGTRSDRPMLQEALALCRLHRAKLVIAKLDRLARNVYFVSSLMESGVDFMACDFPTANRLTVHILASVAEHEAKMISDRTRAALARKKAWYETISPEQRAELEAEGLPTRLGGNRGGLDGVGHLGRAASVQVRSNKADRRAADLAPIIRSLGASGLSQRAIARELTRREIPTPQGKAVWAGPQVASVLARVPEPMPAQSPMKPVRRQLA